MVTVKRDGGVRIEVRSDHLPAHIHIVSANTDVMIDLHTFAIIRGHGEAKEIASALDWAKANHATLIAKWSDINGRG